METFSWKSRDAQGESVIYEAGYFGGWWQLASRPKLNRRRREETETQPVEFTDEIWTELRDLLWRKYQRRRVSWNLVQQVDDILAGKAKNERRDLRKI